MINNEDKYIKYLLWFALAYFSGHVLYYIGLDWAYKNLGDSLL